VPINNHSREISTQYILLRGNRFQDHRCSFVNNELGRNAEITSINTSTAPEQRLQRSNRSGSTSPVRVLITNTVMEPTLECHDTPRSLIVERPSSSDPRLGALCFTRGLGAKHFQILRRLGPIWPVDPHAFRAKAHGVGKIAHLVICPGQIERRSAQMVPLICATSWISVDNHVAAALSEKIERLYEVGGRSNT
jgi:hypothetical protein